MSSPSQSPFQVLDNRPLDQWKVTELKDELRKRKLTISGLKQDLIKRLDEAVRTEREEAAKEESMSCDLDPVAADRGKYAEPVAPDIAQAPIAHGDNGSEKVNEVKVQIDINDSATDLGQAEFEQGGMDTGADSVGKEEVSAVCNTITENKGTAVETTVPQQDLPLAEVKNVNEKSDSQLENNDSKLEHVNEDLKPQLAEEEIKATPVSDLPAANNQVSEVSPNQGFQVSSDFNSNDSVSINEKIGLKDNIIADNAKLELDLGKPEMVEPYSSHVVPDGGESHPMDVEEPHDNILSVKEKNDGKAANAEVSKNNDTEDVGYPEKLNLDRSSGDDSLEEYVPEGKQVVSNYDFVEGVDRSVKNEIPVENEESSVDIVGDGSPATKKDIAVEEKNHVVAEKRKLHEPEAAGNNEPVKRHRKWIAENKVSEPQTSTRSSATILKETFPLAAPKRNFSKTDSKTVDDSLKELVVPPSEKPATNSLRIDNFVRPFTLKAVQELLGKTGAVTSFWMDHIKTHCYVTYSSVDEATATRNAVYNLRWPPYGGQLLAAEFVDAHEVKLRVDLPSQGPAAVPNSTGTAAPQVPPSQPQPSPRQKVSKNVALQANPMHALPPPPPLTNPLSVRERINLPPPPPEKLDPPIVTLDDLFRKTKATPRIYYLPLSEEQVAAKLKVQDRNTKT